MFLTDQEIRTLTGYRRYSAQVRALTASGYKFTVNGLGQPVVAVAEVNRKLVGAKQKPTIVPPVLPDLPVRPMPLDMLRAIGSVGSGPGIYFLWRGPALIYIGRSVNVPARLLAHDYAGTWRNRGGKVIPWDRATAFACRRFDLEDVEKLYIRAYRPQFNAILYA